MVKDNGKLPGVPGAGGGTNMRITQTAGLKLLTGNLTDLTRGCRLNFRVFGESAKARGEAKMETTSRHGLAAAAPGLQK